MAPIGSCPAELAAVGVEEPWLTYFEPEKLARTLSARGFRQVDHLSVEAASRHFVGQPEGIAPLAAWTLLAAIV
jgi:hypothetical protein